MIDLFLPLDESFIKDFQKYSKKALKYKAPSNYIIRPLNKVKELDRMQKLMESMIEKNIKNKQSINFLRNHR